MGPEITRPPPAELVRIHALLLHGVSCSGLTVGYTFKEKGILITGAGRGIGKRLALGFAAVGGRIGLLARSKTEIDLTHLEIEHAGGVSLRLRADVCDFEQMVAAVGTMNAQFGRIDILVCAAGSVGPIGPLIEIDPRQWAHAFETNVAGTMNTVRAVLPQMMERRSGKIVLLVGDGADHPRPFFSAYAASKAALVRFGESLAAELLDHNIQVNCLKPGETYTNMTDEILQAGEKAGWKELQDAAHVRATGGTAADKQIDMIQFLASERSNHLTGKLIQISDDLHRLEHGHIHAEAFTLRRKVRDRSD